MRDIFNTLTERRIQEAIARGDFQNLSCSGKPVKIESLFFLPRKLRAAYTVLKNSGYLNQDTKVDGRFLPPETNAFNLQKSDLTDVGPAITEQELSEKVFNRNVMVDCLRRR